MSAVTHHLLCECPMCRRAWPASPTEVPSTEVLAREAVEDWSKRRRSEDTGGSDAREG